MSQAPATPKPAPQSGPKKGGKKRKKKKAAPPSVPLRTRVSGAARKLLLEVGEAFAGLSSPDLPTRRMSLFFAVTFAGAFVVAGVTAAHFWRLRAERLQAERAAAPERHEGDHGAGHGGDPKREHAMADLGQFTLELKPRPGGKPVAGILDLAEVVLFVECDSPETHEYIEEHLVQVRSEITSVLLRVEREDLLTRDGKARMKREVLDRINDWLPEGKGKVEAVYISKLIVA